MPFEHHSHWTGKQLMGPGGGWGGGPPEKDVRAIAGWQSLSRMTAAAWIGPEEYVPQWSCEVQRALGHQVSAALRRRGGGFELVGV